METRVCQSCGIDITLHAKGKRWRHCAACYWKQVLDRRTPLQELYVRRDSTIEWQKVIQIRQERVKSEIAERTQMLKSSQPWWKKILFLDVKDERLIELQKALYDLNKEQYEIPRQIQSIERSIEMTKTVKKKYSRASKNRNLVLREMTEERHRKQRLHDTCFEEIHQEYERSNFKIQEKDYKRGNALDNYFRNQLSERVFELFNRCCVFCRSRDFLTLDHYAIPKNEGGNFILLVNKTSAFKVNLIVLCRSCNSKKGESRYLDFFNEDQIKSIRIFHQELLNIILNDSVCLKIIRKWYSLVD